MMKIVIFAMIAIAAFAYVDTDQIVPEFEQVELATANPGQQYEFLEDDELVDEDEFASPEVSCDPNKAKREANDKLAKALQKQIAFNPNKVSIKKESEATLMKVADTLHQFPWLDINVIGQSTLRKGSYCNNLTTGRAKAVVDYMKSKGIKNKMNPQGQCSTAVAVKIVAAGGSAPIPHAAIKKCQDEKAEKKKKEVADKAAEKDEKVKEKATKAEEKRKAEEAEKAEKAAAKAKEMNDKKEKALKAQEKKTKEAAAKQEKADKEKTQKAHTKEKKEKAEEVAKKHEQKQKEANSKAEKAAKEAATKKAEKDSKERSTKAAERQSKEHAQKKTCNRDTGGTCRIMNCWSSRGTTECKKYSFWTYKCLCKYGSCPKNGKCYDAITGKFTRL